MRTAVIEIGGTTTRAVVAEPTPGGWYRTHLDRRIVLRLQRAVARDGVVGEGLRLLVAETLRRLRGECFRAGASRTVAVVDAAVAGAGDLHELVRTAARELGASVQVRDDHDEARLLLRVTRPLHGGEAPVVVAEPGERVTRLVTRHVDGVRLAQVPGVVAVIGDPACVPSTRATLVDALHGVPPRCPDGAPPVVVGEIAEAVGRTLLQRRYGPVTPPAERLEVGVDELALLDRELATVSPTQLLLLPAVAPEEADVIARGAAYLVALATRWNADRLVLSRDSATDGQLLEALRLDPAPDTRRTSGVEELCRGAHARTTAHLAADLARGLAPTYRWDDDEVALVRDAALLHDVAVDRVAGAAHREGALEVLRAGVPGCTPQQVVELASLVRFHRGRPPGQHFPPFGRLPAARRRVVTELTGILRLACALDRGEDASVVAVAVDVDPELICVHAFGAVPLDLPLHAAHADRAVVAATLGRQVVVRDAGPVPRSSEVRDVRVLGG
ncbi:HD domain-containing protein [Egicoccus sp. AB-alg2]|uniref:HD domain-containing protein n=1 Tax=Egicoccus sp. AB-alg2 TaxID=3242693 RepID=UPI00359DBA10